MFDTPPFLSIGLHCLSQSQRVMRYVLIWFMLFLELHYHHFVYVIFTRRLLHDSTHILF